MPNELFLEYAQMAVKGLKVEKYYDSMELCLISASTTMNRMSLSKDEWADKEKSRFDAWISTTLSAGNFS